MWTALVALPSTPLTSIDDLPARLASARRISETTSTPRAVAIAAAALFGSGSRPAVTAPDVGLLSDRRQTRRPRPHQATSRRRCRDQSKRSPQRPLQLRA